MDDSFFLDSMFAKELHDRLFSTIDRLEKGLILISSTHAHTKEIQKLKREVGQGVAVIESPAVFDVDGIRGNLRSCFLALENFPSVQTYSGSCIVFDTEKHTWERFYFDLFPKHYRVMDLLMNHLEDKMSEKTVLFKKKKNDIS